jgi:hypothetical protein
MKKLGLTIFAAAVLALPLSAQVTRTFQADIPFEFLAGNTTVAPGQYVIASQTGSPTVHLRGSKSYYLLSNPSQYDATSQEAKLVFHRYGDQYFLSRISTASEGRDIPPSRVERELTKTAAAAGQKPAEIVVAMR